MLKKYGGASTCQKLTFTCQEKLWHIPEIWRVIVDKHTPSRDLILGKDTDATWTLETGILEPEFHTLDKMAPWIVIPVEQAEDIDRKLIIHQEKLSAAMTVKKRVFDKSSGYQTVEKKFYCKRSAGEYVP